MIVRGNKTNVGVLFGGRPAAQPPVPPTESRAVDVAAFARDASAHGVAFAGLLVFTLLLYARPQELFAEALSEILLVKFIAIGTLLAYVIGKLRAGERLTIWPLEVKMLALIVALGILFVPIAFNPQRSIDLLTDTFFKVIIIFV